MSRLGSACITDYAMSAALGDWHTCKMMPQKKPQMAPAVRSKLSKNYKKLYFFNTNIILQMNCRKSTSFLDGKRCLQRLIPLISEFKPRLHVSSWVVFAIFFSIFQNMATLA